MKKLVIYTYPDGRQSFSTSESVELRLGKQTALTVEVADMEEESIDRFFSNRNKYALKKVKRNGQNDKFTLVPLDKK